MAKSKTLDLYNILGLSPEVCNEPNCEELIHKAYIRKAKKCHPDKHPGRTDVQEIFELLTTAYEILKDKKQRAEYNNKLKLENESTTDFDKLKESAMKYLASYDSRTRTDTNDFLIEKRALFEKEFEALNLKNGYNPEMTGAIPDEKIKDKIKEFVSQRMNQDQNYKPNKLFDDGRFDLKKFNAAFDIHHIKDNTIVSHNDFPDAWDNMAISTNYGTTNNISELYVNDNIGTNLYSPVDFSEGEKIEINDIFALDDADYVDEHNKIEEEYYNNIVKKLNERKELSEYLSNIKYDDYNQFKHKNGSLLGCSVEDSLQVQNQYNISKKI